MEEHLSANDWFAAGRYSIADIALYAYTHSADEGGFDLSLYRSVCRWLDRVRTRPNYIMQTQEDSAMMPEAFIGVEGFETS